jgi:peptidyl-prolyl cis-trans isomerase SurA
MKVKLLIIIIYISFTNLLFAQMKNNIVLKVENEIITDYEIKNKILTTLILANQDINQENINSLKKQAVDILIQSKLKKIELTKYNYEVSNIELENYLNKIFSNDFNTQKIKLQKNNLSIDLLLEDFRTQLKWQKFIYQLYSKKIEINQKEINEKVNDIIKGQKYLEEFKISEIEISIENQKSDKIKIQNIINQIQVNGFENTALRSSISSSASNKGDLGWVNAKSLSKKIYKIISNLNVNEVSDPFKNQNSILFLMLKDKRVSKTQDINIKKLKNNIINQKKNELFNLYSRSHLSKLKNTSLIEYK